MAEQEFEIITDSPVKDDLMFWCIAGYECFGCPSAYELRVLSSKPDLDAKQMLGYAFAVQIRFDDAEGSMHQRHAQGHAVRVVRMAKVGRFYQYHLTLRSWFWLLTKRVNSRIFQEQTCLEMVHAVVDSTPLKNVKKLEADSLISPHPAHRYCTQYQESDAQFLQRLLEGEGVYYWFDVHDKLGTMRLSDTSAVAHAKLPVNAVLRQWSRQAGSQPRFNELLGLSAHHRAGSGAYASRDSDFKAIGKRLQSDYSDPDAHELSDLEVFEFPGGYLRNDDREVNAHIRMAELAAERELYEGRTNWADVAVGHCFEYQREGDSDAPDGEYLIAACVFCLRQTAYEGVDSKAQADVLASELTPLLLQHAQSNPLFAESDRVGPNWLAMQIRDVIESGTRDDGQGNFGLTALSVNTPYKPKRQVRRPVMPGPQSAIVTGPEGEELFVDEHGRVKVQFHWDRYGQRDENTTCWVRVSQPWAGKGWGGYFMPRIGQEVIVDFLNGDPDRPIIMGRVYNDEQPIPYDSPTQSGIKTRSTPGGDTSTFNELRFEDAIGKEQIHLHAEKDLDVLVEKMETRKVGTNRFTKIAGMCQTSTGGKRTADIGKDDVLKVVKDQNINVGGEQGVTVVKKVDYAFHSTWTAAANAMTFNSVNWYKLSAYNIETIATTSFTITSASYALRAPSVSVNATTVTQKASKGQHISAGEMLRMSTDMMHVRASTQILLQCGHSRIVIGPDLILLSSPQVQVEGSTAVNINGTTEVRIQGGLVKVNA